MHLILEDSCLHERCAPYGMPFELYVTDQCSVPILVDVVPDCFGSSSCGSHDPLLCFLLVQGTPESSQIEFEMFVCEGQICSDLNSFPRISSIFSREKCGQMCTDEFTNSFKTRATFASKRGSSPETEKIKVILDDCSRTVVVR